MTRKEFNQLSEVEKQQARVDLAIGLCCMIPTVILVGLCIIFGA